MKFVCGKIVNNQCLRRKVNNDQNGRILATGHRICLKHVYMDFSEDFRTIMGMNIKFSKQTIYFAFCKDRYFDMQNRRKVCGNTYFTIVLIDDSNKRGKRSPCMLLREARFLKLPMPKA